MLKALAIVVILLLASTSAVARASSGRLITVQTDKPYYYVGDTVHISGRLTYNDGPIASKLVVIDVRLSGSTGSYHWTTKYTDLNGIYTDSFPLAGGNAILGEYIVSVASSVADVPCTNQTTFQLGAPTLPVPVVPLGTLTATVAMILVLAAYFTLTKRKRARGEMPNPGPSVDSCALRTISVDGGASSSIQN